MLKNFLCQMKIFPNIFIEKSVERLFRDTIFSRSHNDIHSINSGDNIFANQYLSHMYSVCKSLIASTKFR